MIDRSARFLVDGAAGPIECTVERPAGAAAGLAVIGHPHPLYGGTMDNKVTATLARAFAAAGWAALRFNFRGVGASGGTHDHGHGETDDLLRLLERFPAHPQAAGAWPAGGPAPALALAGFSFGSFVAARAAVQLAAQGRAPHHLVLVGAAAGKWPLPAVAADTLVIHGERDETIPLADVLDWARPLELPVVVMPGADHFFHRRLTMLRQLVLRGLLGATALRERAPAPAGAATHQPGPAGAGPDAAGLEAQ